MTVKWFSASSSFPSHINLSNAFYQPMQRTGDAGPNNILGISRRRLAQSR
jgi:hypothetical protein